LLLLLLLLARVVRSPLLTRKALCCCAHVPGRFDVDGSGSLDHNDLALLLAEEETNRCGRKERRMERRPTAQGEWSRRMEGGGGGA